MTIIKKLKEFKKPIIEYNNRKYIFSIRSLIIFAIGAPLSAYLIYLFYDLEINYYLHEIVVKQTVYFLNLFFNMNVEAQFAPSGKYDWRFNFPLGNIDGDPLSSIYFETFCTGIQAICVFAGIIIFTPHSQDKDTKKDVVWRKTKSLIISSVIFYVVNIIRMLIQIDLYYIGYSWNDIHFSISAASSFIAAIIVLLMHKWIPEFILSIIYIGTLISEPIKQERKEKVKISVETSNQVKIKTIRKILRMERKSYHEKISGWAEKFGYTIEGDELVIPDAKVSEFIELLMLDKPFSIENSRTKIEK
ncbi:MAG: archaeosortase H [Candidatus Hodarchaeota archaeon]